VIPVFPRAGQDPANGHRHQGEMIPIARAWEQHTYAPTALLDVGGARLEARTGHLASSHAVSRSLGERSVPWQQSQNSPRRNGILCARA
jgi:hypothetical protein